MPLAIDVLLGQLVRNGFTAVFGNPGTFEQALLDRLDRYPQLRYVLCLHESVAIGIGIGYARVLKRPAFIQLHGSVGLGNGVGMLLEAKQSKTPLVVYVGENSQYDEAFQGFLASDLPQIGGPVCKATVRVTVPDQLTRQLRRAIQIAMTPPFGPVLFAVPMEVLEYQIAADDAHVTDICLSGGAAVENVARAVDWMLSAERPMIVVGDAVAWTGAQSIVRDLSHLVGAPVYGLGWTMCDAIYDDPLFQEPLTHAVGMGNAKLLREADVLLVIGSPLAWEVIPDRDGYVALGAKLLQIDSDPNELGRNFPADLAFYGEVRQVLAQFLHTIQHAATADFINRATLRRDTLRERRLARRRDLEVRWGVAAKATKNHPFAMFAALAEFIRCDDLVFEEAMTAQPFLRHTFPLSDPELYYPALSRCLGAGWPGAVGAALANPGARVVAVSSDGAAMYVPQTLWTAAHLDLNMLFVVANNFSYRVLKLNLNEFRNRIGGHRGDYPFMDLTRPSINFVHLASSMGVKALAATTPDEVRSAMTRLTPEKGPRLLDLQISGELDY